MTPHYNLSACDITIGTLMSFALALLIAYATLVYAGAEPWICVSITGKMSGLGTAPSLQMKDAR